MKQVVHKISVISCSLLLLSGCASDSAFMSLFGQEASTDYSKTNLPTLGSTNFEAIEVSNVDYTGTIVGQKVIAFRNELTELQNSIKKNNAELQSVRASVIQNAIEYHNTTAAMEAKLQMGTTPGNPIMYSMLQKTQGNVVVMDENTNTLNKIYNQAVSDVSVVNNLLDSIRATYSVSGALDEDHAQLRTMENETGQTAILLNSLISEVGNDFTRQLEYTNNARTYLASLDKAIKVGSYGINNPPLSSNFEATTTGNKNKYISQTNVSNNKLSGRPLFAIKLNKDNINYHESLQRAISAAKSRNKNFRYEVVAVSPVSANSNIKTKTQNHAVNIFQELISLGINSEHIDLLSKTSPNITSAEVQIFIK